MLQDGSCRPWILIQYLLKLIRQLKRLQQPVSCPHDVCSQFFNSRNCPVLSPSVRGEISVTIWIFHHTIRGWPQQGDLLGPLLFCLPLQPILVKLSSPLVFGYLDDISLGGPTSMVAEDC